MQVFVHLVGSQVVAEHMPLMQMFDVQSALAAQPLPLSHLVEQVPPQSMSVSLPFFAPSVHVAVAQRPPVHAPPVQSVFTEQSSPFAQSGQLPPPQSTSVSAAFFTPSVQVYVAQWPDVQ
jgi:hypothetical protein